MPPRRTALITGAGRNIGRACALYLAQDGYNVVVNGSSDRAACEKVAQECTAHGVEALVAMGDVGEPRDAARIAFEGIARFGAIDVLVNNAAIRPGKPFLETSDEEWRRVMAVDLDAAVWLSRACLPKMIERGWGRIVNFTGMNAMQGTGGRPSVTVAKHGIWGLTKALAREFGARGVTVNAISPGPIAGDRDNDDPASVTHRQDSVRNVPLGRMGTAGEIAGALRLLVGDDGAFINGQMLQINGGAAT
ncbi:MAG: SDR family oxidoreductase [Alphaproteobacteria bacterium]|nr:SDR family oxidoreductase [Alphaproteobacteria bacterium]MCW5740370.1 SDR family oxidoreductase [Alphaproteobacteria bacterium]